MMLLILVHLTTFSSGEGLKSRVRYEKRYWERRI
jgi:hypothetical protein